MTDLMFNFDSRPVRIEMKEGEPWWCLKDVCDVLHIHNHNYVATNQLDLKGVGKTYPLTAGGRQETTYINEPNLYRLIFRSNKKETARFRDWVFNDVLPAIRKTGRYAPAAEAAGKEVLAAWASTKLTIAQGTRLLGYLNRRPALSNYEIARLMRCSETSIRRYKALMRLPAIKKEENND
jgi:prophage antirepressor-like protein